MSLTVPDNVLSDVIQACKSSDMSLFVSDGDRRFPSITMRYQITKGSKFSWWTLGPMSKTNCEPTVYLASPPGSANRAVEATSVAIHTAAGIEMTAHRAGQKAKFNMSTRDAVRRAEKAVDQISAETHVTNDPDSGDSWFHPNWLQEGHSESVVTDEAATALTKSLAFAWYHPQQRASATHLVDCLSKGSNNLAALKTWLDTLGSNAAHLLNVQEGQSAQNTGLTRSTTA